MCLSVCCMCWCITGFCNKPQQGEVILWSRCLAANPRRCGRTFVYAIASLPTRARPRDGSICWCAFACMSRRVCALHAVHTVCVSALAFVCVCVCVFHAFSDTWTGMGPREKAAAIERANAQNEDKDSLIHRPKPEDASARETKDGVRGPAEGDVGASARGGLSKAVQKNDEFVAGSQRHHGLEEVGQMVLCVGGFGSEAHLDSTEILEFPSDLRVSKGEEVFAGVVREVCTSRAHARGCIYARWRVHARA